MPAASRPSPPLDGRYDGALLHLTLGLGADFVFERLLRLWLPWLGKRFDAASASGENVFDMSAYRAGERLTPAAYRAWWPEDVHELPGAAVHAPRLRRAGSIPASRCCGSTTTCRRTRRRCAESSTSSSPCSPASTSDRRCCASGGRRRLAWFTLE